MSPTRNRPAYHAPQSQAHQTGTTASCDQIPGTNMSGRTYLPVALHMQDQSAIVVGAGEPAYFKAVLLADFGIATTVVAPTDGADPFDERLQDMQDVGDIRLWRRPYVPSDLEGHRLAIITTGDRDMDYAIEADARARGLLVNVVDDPAHCDFFASAYVKHGSISIAVNSGGASPGFTGALKDDLAQRYGPEIEDHLEHYLAWRRLVRERVDGFPNRERLWRGLRADGLYDLLRTEGPDAARALVESRIEAWTDSRKDSAVGN